MGILTCEQIEDRVSNGAVLLDVRTVAEYNQVRLPGASLIPLNDLHKVQDQIDAGTEILVYCRTGARSGQAAGVLSQWGYDAKNIGGVIHYMQCLEY